MRRSLLVALTVSLAFSLCGSVSARDAARTGIRPERSWSKEDFPEVTDQGLLNLYKEAAVDTYCLVWYTFEQMNWQGWTRVDRTAQVDTFWHVEDYLEPELVGLPGPLEGTKSMWCGAPPGPSNYLCRWSTAPGYGNKWDQWLVSNPVYFTGFVTLSYRGYFDSEEDYDYTYVEYDAGYGDWREIASYTGEENVTATHQVITAQIKTKLRFRFESDGAWSDEDGLYDSKGAAHVDSITVADVTGVINFENFESASDRAKRCGIWHAAPGTSYGVFSALHSNLLDKDPCGDNYATQITFFIPNIWPSPDYPGLYDTPFCKGLDGIGPCQNEMVVSPVIDMAKYSLTCNNVQNGTIPPGDLPLLGGSLLRFTVYRDLPFDNSVFYYWLVRTVSPSGCPGQWQSDNFVYWGDERAYIYHTFDIGRYVGGSEKIQVGLVVHDMCDVNPWGFCTDHTPAPWFDNVRVYRYKEIGPQWSYRDIDLFQDNFPPNETPPWETVRADAAIDIRDGSLGIDPGDSIVVDCTSPLGGGIDTMPNGYPAVYMHVNAHWIGAGSPPGPPLGAVIHGAQLQGTCGLWLSTDGGGWDIIQMDFARTAAGVAADRYMVDLNDSLFVPGYIIEYYLTANDNASTESALPKWARSIGPYFEFTCLPTGNSDILFVDDFSGRGSWNGVVEDYWQSAFSVIQPPSNRPDKYDVNGPSSSVSNGPGSRANAPLMQYQYDVVVWDSGDLDRCTISDGTGHSDKSNDCQLLLDWMYTAEHPCGLWVCGDDIAYDLTTNDLLSPQALSLMSTWCGVTLVNTSYAGLTLGGVVNPLVQGDPAGIFIHGGQRDKFYANGSCPVVNQFDCLGKTGNGQYALDYPPYSGTNYYAGIQAVDTNAAGYVVRTMWFGFSFMYVRDDKLETPNDRTHIAMDVFTWMQQTTSTGVDNRTAPKAYRLAQNFPNPFNPVTEIKYDMKEKGLVTVKIYNVAGQLVRTLVDGVEGAGSHTAIWDGRNNLGVEAASGIYFYKMEAAGFSATKKMVLLR